MTKGTLSFEKADTNSLYVTDQGRFPDPVKYYKVNPVWQ